LHRHQHAVAIGIDDVVRFTLWCADVVPAQAWCLARC
jgi:hypothetical protein